jgi:diphthine-ammonia ligase
MLALDRARRQGLDIAYLFNIYEGVSGRVRFHGIRKELIEIQADALGIPLLQTHTHPHDYEMALRHLFNLLKENGVDGIVFGNIHLADIYAWYHERVVAYGFQHIEPLWGDEPTRLIRELIERGYRGRIVSIDLARVQPDWLGAPFDLELIRALEAAEDVDVCGERGEYHSFVFDGPLFRRSVSFTEGEAVEMEGHRLLDLLPDAHGEHPHPSSLPPDPSLRSGGEGAGGEGRAGVRGSSSATTA